MANFFIRRSLATIATTILVATIIFLLLHALPGDPAIMILSSMEESPSPEAVQAMRAKLGLDRPLYVQYFDWFTGVLRGDFGTSLITDRPVIQDLSMRLPRTLALIIPSVTLAVLIGVPLGVMAAVKRGSFLDPLVSAVALLWYSTPVFVSGLLLVLFFSLHLGWLPTGGYVALSDDPIGFLRRVTLPTIALTLGPMATIMRMTRSSVLEQIRLDYVRTAWAKGLSYRIVLYRHVLRNALIPVVTVIGLQVGFMFAGTVLAEAVFTWPGVSSLLMRAVSFRDYPVVQGVILIVAVAFILANFITDMSYGFLDPRIRYN